MNMETLNLDEEKMKRLFRSRGKISYPGAVCHITQRAGGKEVIFVEDADYLYMLHLIKEKSKKFRFAVLAFCLMSNHLHLLIRLSENNLSESMKALFGEFAIFFNKKYERKGHVFGGAYRQSLCLDDAYLLAASIYIHLNPFKACLINNPWDYRWSSCNLYIHNIEKETFIDYGIILQMLDPESEKSRFMYKDILVKSKDIGMKQVWEEPKALEFFKNKILKSLPMIGLSMPAEITAEQGLDREIEELKRMGKLFNPESIKARKFIIEQLRARGYPIKEISERLSISQRSIYNTLKA